MKYFIYNLITGKIRSTFSGPTEFLEYQLQDNEDYIPAIDNIDDSTHYVDINKLELIPMPVKPHNYAEFNWETKQWESKNDYIISVQTDSKQEVNKIAAPTIIIKYPMYKQMNIGRDPSSPEAIAMYEWIDGIRAESNRINTLIDNSNSIEVIKELVTQFTDYCKEQ